MFVYTSLLFFVLFCLRGLRYNADSVVDGTELLMSFLVHRHGERTPVQSSLTLSNHVDELRKASAKYGFGQLTNVGKRRSYQLGQFIRRRYDKLLSPTFNRSEIYVRSTDFIRAKMTVLTALAAVYPATADNWSTDINWTPVPYTTVPAKYDFNLAIINCPKFKESFFRSKITSTVPELDLYADTLAHWSHIVGNNISSQPLIIPYALYDLYACQISLGVPLEDEIAEIYPEIEQIAAIAIKAMFYTDSMRALSAGVLLNEFFTVADKVIAGVDVQKVHIYSAHDVNVFALEAATKVANPQGVPKYASAYALELRKVVDTGEYVVVPVYLNTPKEEVITYLEIEDCGQRCAYESFRSTTSRYNLKESEWRAECGFYDDLDVDSFAID
uniref:acid phosphatase n=2 Tax=Spodoptera frugiperda TaxID=7108 RepID=A0A2H1W2H8_SPOFR